MAVAAKDRKEPAAQGVHGLKGRLVRVGEVIEKATVKPPENVLSRDEGFGNPVKNFELDLPHCLKYVLITRRPCLVC